MGREEGEMENAPEPAFLYYCLSYHKWLEKLQVPRTQYTGCIKKKVDKSEVVLYFVKLLNVWSFSLK